MSQLSIFSVEQANKTAEGNMPGLLGIKVKDIEPPRMVAKLAFEAGNKTPRDYLHVATVTVLAATTPGYWMPKPKAGMVGRSRRSVARR